MAKAHAKDNIKYRHINQDDKIRREVITELLCHSHIQFDDLDQKYDINSRDYLSSSINELKPMLADELVMVDDVGVRISDRGRLVVRNACMAFDHYLQRNELLKQERQRFSSAI